MRRPRSRQEVALELPAQDESFSGRHTSTAVQAGSKRAAKKCRQERTPGHRPSEPIARIKNVAAVIFPDLRRELYRLKEYRPPECENLESRAYSRPAGPPH